MPKEMAEDMKKNFHMISFYSTMVKNNPTEKAFLHIIRIKLAQIVSHL
jgi:hypothetical protein